MAIELGQDAETYLIGSIKPFFAEDMEDEIGDLKAMRVLEFVLREIGPTVYNRAIADAQTYFQDKVADLSGSRFEPELAFWKKTKDGRNG